MIGRCGSIEQETEGEDTLERTASEAASIQRRLRFAGCSQIYLKTALHRMGLGGFGSRLGRIPHNVTNVLYDLAEGAWNGFQWKNPGQVHIAALEAPIRLAQTPRHQGYWYDAQRHALVGMHLGLDLVRNRGRYHLIEANLSAALRPERRSLYCSKLDPFIGELLSLVKRHNFKRIVLLRPGWSEDYLKEFELAQSESGVQVIGASSSITNPRSLHPMIALPDPLQENTVYVIFSGQNTPLSLFFHDKLRMARWLQETIDTHPSDAELLTYVPTFQTLTLPSEPQDPMWPNLVVKLASGDQGKFVLMGRFRSEAHARDELRLHNPDDIPGVFDIGLWRKMLDRVFPRLQALYQPFIPPEIVDGALSTIRLHLFVSPLTHQFLSAHNVVTNRQIPEVLPEGLIEDASAYIRSFSTYDCRFEKPEGAIESELRRVAQEYDRIADLAVREKFFTGPDSKAEFHRN